MAESGRPESASPRMMGLLLFALVLLGCSAGSSACCSTWTAFPKTNNVYGQVTGSCKEAGKQPTVADPCFAGLQAAHQATVTATTYVEFGPVESLELCEAAASASPLQPPCVSVTWHSPECAGCGPAWMKHCYCMTDSTWLKDPGNPLAGSADQVGVVSAKCTEPGCGGGWTVVALLLGGAGLYLGGGAAYRSKTMGAKGRQMIPHLHFWEELEGLVHDGAAFARGGGSAKKRSGEGRDGSPSYGSVAESSSSSQQSSSGSGGGGNRSKEKREKKEKKEHTRKQGKSGSSSSKNDSSTSLLGESSSPTAAPPAAAAPAPAAAGTASAGGGRWVHVPT